MTKSSIKNNLEKNVSLKAPNKTIPITSIYSIFLNLVPK